MRPPTPRPRRQRVGGLFPFALAALVCRAAVGSLLGAEGPGVEEIARAARPAVTVVSYTGREGEGQGMGAGFVVRADGLIATNLHVIGEARPISVQLADGRRFDVVEVVASDRALDLALIRVEARDLPVLPLGDSSAARDGQPLVALGNPHGLKHSVVGGVLSGRREIDGRPMLQLAMPIEPGNSGGPVLDAQGRVLGVVTMKSLVNDNLGFAVAIDSLKPLLEKPNPIPMSRWLTIGGLDAARWTPLFGARWRQRAGRVVVSGAGDGFGGRSLCLWREAPPEPPYEVAVEVKLDDEAGAAGLVFHADGGQKHYGFYPSGGKLRVSRFDGPDVFSWKVLEETPSEHYRPGGWNTLKVRVEKDRFRCYLNDALVVESTDAGPTAGQVGLAKFRQTEAEFKGFRVAKELPPLRLAPAEAARLQAEIAALPPLGQLAASHLEGLTRSGDAARAALGDEAAALEARAADLRRVAADLHARRAAAELAKALAGPEAERDLTRAALVVAWLDDAELDIAPYVAQIDRMADEIRRRLPADAPAADRLKELNKYLFEENGYHGGRTNYYHPANSHLHRVLEDREGLPITLAVLYLELGRRVGLRLEGVGLPTHFVARRADGAHDAFIDVFERGQALTVEEAEQLVRRNTGDSSFSLAERFPAATKSEIIQRMLQNLLGVARRSQDREAMLRYLEALLAVAPDAASERGMRAVLRYETGRRDAALADLDWFLQTAPEGVDLEQIRALRRRFETQPPPRR